MRSKWCDKNQDPVRFYSGYFFNVMMFSVLNLIFLSCLDNACSRTWSPRGGLVQTAGRTLWEKRQLMNMHLI